MRRSSDWNGGQKHQQNRLLEGDDNATAEHLRSLAAIDPAREQGIFGQIVAAFLRNARMPGQQPNNDETDIAPYLPSAPCSFAVTAAAIAGPKIA